MINRQPNDLDLLKQVKEKVIETNFIWVFGNLLHLDAELKEKSDPFVFRFNIDHHISHGKSLHFSPTQMLALDG